MTSDPFAERDRLIAASRTEEARVLRALLDEADWVASAVAARLGLRASSVDRILRRHPEISAEYQQRRVASGRTAPRRSGA